MKVLLLMLLPVLGMAQSFTKYQMVLTPSIVDEVLVLKSNEVSELPTFIHFTAEYVEVSNSVVTETIYVDRTLDKRTFLGRTKKGRVAVVQLLYMKNVFGKKMVVLRVSLDQEYFFFPEKPYIK